MKIRILPAAVFLALASAAAAAETAAPFKLTDPMRVAIVRSAAPGCEPNCTEWISAEGYIVEGTAANFARVIATLGKRKLPIFIQSPGGSVADALSIGRLVRANRLDVTVGSTSIMACAAGDAACRSGPLRGMPRRYRSICASSCVFVLAGGVHRSAAPFAIIGVHQITTFQTVRHYVVISRRVGDKLVEVSRKLIPEGPGASATSKTPTPQQTYDNLRAYFAEMGVSPAIMPLLMAAPANEVTWLTPAQLRSTGLVTEGLGREGLVPPLNAAPEPPVAARRPPDAAPDGEATSSLPRRGASGEVMFFGFAGRDLDVTLTFTPASRAPSIDLAIDVTSVGAPVPTQPMAAYVMLAGGNWLAARNTDGNSPTAPLVGRLPIGDFCAHRRGTALLRLEAPGAPAPATTSFRLMDFIGMPQLEANTCPTAPLIPPSP
jgi:hypothetical protein